MRARSFALVSLTLLCGAAAARAQSGEAPLVHPIYVHLPDAPEHDAVRRAFTEAAERYKLRPVEVVDVPAPPPPRAPDLLKLGILHAQALSFDEAQRELDSAANEVTRTGGDSLTTADLARLYLHRAMVTARADWKADPKAPPTEARARAQTDYERAAVLAAAIDVNEIRRVLPPQAVADLERAIEAVRQRPRGTLIVKGSADAQVSLDGGDLQPVAGGVTFRDLPFGEHLLRVEEVGRALWGAAIRFEQPTFELEIPPRAPLSLDNTTAAAHARRMGARFALVLEPKGGPAAPVSLRLVEVTGIERDAAVIPSGREAGRIDAAVMRLDERARRIAQATPAGDAAMPAAGEPANLAPPVLLDARPARPGFSEDPVAWARDHWPLLTAVGTLLLSTALLSAAASH